MKSPLITLSFLLLLPAATFASDISIVGIQKSAFRRPAVVSHNVPPAPAVISETNSSLATQTCSLRNFEQQLIDRVNQARASSRSCGGVLYKAATPVTWNTKLVHAAVAHSADMATKNFFSHTSADGRSVGDRIAGAGYQWGSYAENIGAGQTTVDQIMNDWLASPSHCANVMKSSMTEVGVACVNNEAAPYKTYWSMDFAHPA